MQLQLKHLLSLCLLAVSGYGIDAYRILFLCPFPAPSHWLWLEHFQRDLLRRGHEVTSIHNHPTKKPHENLTEIILNPTFDIPKHFPKENIFSMRYNGEIHNMQSYWKIGLMTTEHALQDVQLRQLIHSTDEHYDLVIMEQFFHEAMLMFGHKFNAPVATIGTLGYADNMHHSMGLLTPWSFVPNLLLPHTDQMSFSQRAYNLYLGLYDAVMRRWYYMPRMQQLAEKYFGTAIKGPLPNVQQLERNISLMLLNSHRGVDVPRPSMPGLINVGGAHIQPAKKLPEEMQGFLDNATHGAVYFSLGSYMKSTDMPPEKLAQLLQAFGRLKQLVLWKYENATLGQLPPNVMISKWLPQNDILAHPNVKVFITHGGMFSTQEGIHWGVPMLFIPLFGDQHRNAIRSVRGGNARLLSYSKLNADQLVEHLEALIYEPQYKRNALEMSQRFRDNAIHPLEEASYWLEYIVKHRGAAHLKSHGAFMPLYQYLMLDVLGCVLLALALVWYLLGKLYRWWIAGVAAAASASSQARQVKKQL